MLAQQENEVVEVGQGARRDQLFRQSTKTDRLAALAGWASGNPLATTAQAREFLLGEFGQAVGNHDLSKVMREARQAYQVRQVRVGAVPAMPTGITRPLPGTHGIEFLARTMRELGVRLISINEDGGYEVQLRGRL